jgi:hypothetical protein
MAKLEGGIFSNPSGKTAGIVFGAARTRQGKKVTARQLVPPSNPNTASQQTQRGKFSDALDIVRYLGAEIYQDYFNRAISQLPGFQSMMSIFMNAMDSSKELSAPPTINLGTLHLPDTIDFASVSADTANLQISAELGDNGTDDDEIWFFAIDATSTGRATLVGGKSTGGDNRSGESTLITGLTTGNDYLCGMFLVGQGDASGLLSQCVWDIVTIS